MQQETFMNPVVPGDFPDPSIVRVDDDYYLVNSTFQYFPGIPLSHSRDLVNWEVMGHILTRKSQLDLEKVADSAGIWAPDISFHDGVFRVVYTLQTPNAGLNCMVWAETPEGPYSDPVVLNDVGIDPSIFTDDDGTHYFVASSGSHGKRFMYRMSDDCTSLTGEEMLLWAGTGKHCPEGPHIFRTRGYYYLVLAEGGTGYGHCETCARARDIKGPYEASPHNPVLSPVSDIHPIQKTGHGKPVETQNGEWWFVYLGSRPFGGRHCNLGRETFLSPIQWTDDDWFTIGPPEIEHTRPNLPEHIFSQQSDNLLATTMGEWQSDRYADETAVRHDMNSGSLHLFNSAFVCRQKHVDFEATAIMQIRDNNKTQDAGLIILMDGKNRITLTRNGDYWILKVTVNDNREEYTARASRSKLAWFRIEAQGQEFSFSASGDGSRWYRIGPTINARFLSPESVLATKHKCFTGVRLGLFDKSEEGDTCFACFEYRETAKSPSAS